jgi:hypothetical protein
MLNIERGTRMCRRQGKGEEGQAVVMGLELQWTPGRWR